METDVTFLVDGIDITQYISMESVSLNDEFIFSSSTGRTEAMDALMYFKLVARKRNLEFETVRMSSADLKTLHDIVLGSDGMTVQHTVSVVDAHSGETFTFSGLFNGNFSRKYYNTNPKYRASKMQSTRVYFVEI